MSVLYSDYAYPGGRRRGEGQTEPIMEAKLTVLAGICFEQCLFCILTMHTQGGEEEGGRADRADNGGKIPPLSGQIALVALVKRTEIGCIYMCIYTCMHTAQCTWGFINI